MIFLSLSQYYPLLNYCVPRSRSSQIPRNINNYGRIISDFMKFMHILSGVKQKNKKPTQLLTIKWVFSFVCGCLSFFLFAFTDFKLSLNLNILFSMVSCGVFLTHPRTMVCSLRAINIGATFLLNYFLQFSPSLAFVG